MAQTVSSPLVTRVLAIDVGTSSARARLYDERGMHVEGVEAQVRYTATRGHSGRMGEFDADELVGIVGDAVEEARREAGGRVDAVGASCFWHSLVLASGTGLLRLDGAWDDELLAAIGVEPDRLPEIDDAPVGDEEPWFPALGDGACSNLGA